MACLAGVFLCCCAEGAWLSRFTFSSCALTPSVTPIGRALPGVYVLTTASELCYWVVALDIDASVDSLFFFPFPVIYCIPWDIRPRLLTMDSECVVGISLRCTFFFVVTKVGRRGARGT